MIPVSTENKSIKAPVKRVLTQLSESSKHMDILWQLYFCLSSRLGLPRNLIIVKTALHTPYSKFPSWHAQVRSTKLTMRISLKGLFKERLHRQYSTITSGAVIHTYTLSSASSSQEVTPDGPLAPKVLFHSMNSSPYREFSLCVFPFACQHGMHYSC